MLAKAAELKLAAIPPPAGSPRGTPRETGLRTTPEGEDGPGQGRLVPSTKASSGLTAAPRSAGCRPRPAVNQGPEGARQLCIVRWGWGYLVQRTLRLVTTSKQESGRHAGIRILMRYRQEVRCAYSGEQCLSIRVCTCMHTLAEGCLENPRDRGAWWAAVHGVAQSRTRLKQLSSSSSMYHM